MNPLWILTSIMTGAALGGTAWLVARLLSYRHISPARCGAEFSVERYLCMSSLLAREDVEFLAQQPGVGKDEIAEFKREQRTIFRSYLMELAGDFEALHARLRKLAVDAPEQYGDQVAELVGKKVSFMLLIARLEIQLALAPLGVKVNPQPLMDLVGSLGRSVSAVGPVAVN